ncbi:MAG: CPBP family intramembrane metalloprotease [Desulfosporosinus sp.]|nr:CPBP family intramembrane metalloprotease [Desulfosporosinus sp.]
MTLGFTLDHALRDSLIGLFVGTGMILLSIILLRWAGWVQPHTISHFSWSVLAFASLAMLFNTISQEILVRGYFLQTIQPRGGALIAVISSAALFSLLHAGGTRGALLPSFNLFAAGLLLGYAYIATGNLWMPIALHFAWNFLQGPVLGLTVSGQSLDCGWRIFHLEGPGIFTGGTFGLEGGLVATITTMVGLLALYGLYHR